MITLGLPLPALAQDGATDRTRERRAEERAAATVRNMTQAEKLSLVMGIIPAPLKGVTVPKDALISVGYVPGVPRLGIPSLKETDGSVGVAYSRGMRKDGATAFPSALAMASSWNPELLRRVGSTIGTEARAKGFNVLLGGGSNLIREPRNGRTYEYLGEDPLLTGRLVGASIAGIQSNNMIATIKHFALNDQETGRGYVDVRIGEAAARESDLLAFQIGIEQGRPGSVMCAYNKVNGHHGCHNDWLLNSVLKHDWRFPGFVMSDWGAVHGVDAAVKGLDQQSGAQLDPDFYFGKPLAAAIASDPGLVVRLDDMNKRILTAIYAGGLDNDPKSGNGVIDKAAGAAVAEDVARQGIVLLRNTRGVLPLGRSASRIAVIGGHADVGVLSGAGGTQVHEEQGPALVIPHGGDGPRAAINSEQYHRSSPLKAIQARAPQAEVSFRDGRYISDAVALARKSDVAIVFATEWRIEGRDVPDLTLPEGQDALIAAVAEANPNTIVVLETGGPVLMPWLDKTAAVVEAWYPGMRGGEALAAILFGDVDPSGRLPVTFPTSLDQLPRPVLEGRDGSEVGNVTASGPAGAKLDLDYDIEGSDVGYRWFARTNKRPLFPFGHGLSYTRFETSVPQIAGMKASFTVRNLGARPGTSVAQLYLTARNGERKKRLVGFARVDLASQEAKRVEVTLDPRLLADWKDDGWEQPAGIYEFAVGQSSEVLGPSVKTRLAHRHWRD